MNEPQIASYLYLRTDAELIRVATRFLGQPLNLNVEEAVETLRVFLPGEPLPFDGFGGFPTPKREAA
jgi:hypothetical protein